MKKVLLMIMLVFIGMVGCSKQGVSIEDIQKEGTLLIGLSGDYPPFEFYKMVDGKETLVGFDVMLGWGLTVRASGYGYFRNVT